MKHIILHVQDADGRDWLLAAATDMVLHSKELDHTVQADVSGLSIEELSKLDLRLIEMRVVV